MIASQPICLGYAIHVMFHVISLMWTLWTSGRIAGINHHFKRKRITGSHA